MDSDFEEILISELAGDVECVSVCGQFLTEFSVRSDGCPPATETTTTVLPTNSKQISLCNLLTLSLLFCCHEADLIN